MRIAFDMSSYMWTSLLVGKDEENGFEVPHPSKADKKVWVNSAAWGYENIINMMTSALHQFQLAPIDTLLVFEGMHSKKGRMHIDPDYKGTRDDRPTEAYAEFEKLREQMKSLWLSLGACLVHQDYVEGDDVLAWLAKESESDLVIATRDRDLTVLNQVNHYGAKIQVLCGDRAIGDNPYGPWPLALIPLHKALVGDSSDNIKGCVGFGDAKWVQFLAKYDYDGAQELLDLLEQGSLDALAPQAEECKLIKMIVTQEQQVLKSYRCGRLYPEWVNTLKHPVVFTPGMVTQRQGSCDERLAQWFGESYLIDMDSYAEAMTYAVQHLEASPNFFLDIETSSVEESDEWLAAQGEADGVDPLGHKLTSMGFTFGRNNQITYYFTHKHKDAKNLTTELIRDFVVMAARRGKPIVIQNFGGFEGPILHEEWGTAMAQAFPEFRGFLPNVLDTALEASYVNENEKRGLKQRSKMHLGYEQKTYYDTVRKAGLLGSLPAGGKRVGEPFEQVIKSAVLDTSEPFKVVDGSAAVLEPAVTEIWETRQYKMNELTAEEVFDYGTDDTICTAALHNYYRLMMELDHHWQVYLDVEIGAMYQHAKNFLDGTAVSIETSNRLMREDDEKAAKAWATVRDWLIKVGFDGTVCPQLDGSEPLSLADIKEIFSICVPRTALDVDEDGEPTPRKMRKNGRAVGNMSLPKALIHIREVEEQPTLALLLEPLTKPGFTQADTDRLNAYLQEHFDGEPENPVGSPKKMQRILYEIMGLPIKVRNNATEKMRAAGVLEGTPKTDTLAIEYALRTASDEHKEVLRAIKIIQMVRTRHSLFYDKYPMYVHWKTGRIHSQHNQCEANTRRASESKVNKQQLPKHMKIEGEPPLFRQVIVPHKKNAVVVSMDFESQELVILAEYSRDPNLIAIFVPPPGEKKKSQHSITGLGIFKSGKLPGFDRVKAEYKDCTYAQFEEILEDKSHPWYADAKMARALGKKTNFTAEYGAMAKKVQLTLLLDTEEEAQGILDAREAQFPLLGRWKRGVIEEVKSTGIVRSMGGAVRHLRNAIVGADAWDAMKAERQAVNFKVQGSAAEQTKLAEGRMWKQGLFFDYDAVCYGPIHDEIVASVAIEDLFEFLPKMHACMVENYGGISAVPIGSSISFGPEFGTQIEIGSEPTREAIQKGLAELNGMAVPMQLAV